MSKDVPMASHLLSTKVFGISARKLAESVGPPLTVPILLYAIGVPLLITAPFVILGGITGLVIYTRTPEGQRPLRYAAAIARHVRGRTEYLWKPPAAGEHDIAHREPFEGWITGHPSTADDGATENGDGDATADTETDTDTGPASEWPVATMTVGETQK